MHLFLTLVKGNKSKKALVLSTSRGIVQNYILAPAVHCYALKLCLSKLRLMVSLLLHCWNPYVLTQIKFKQMLSSCILLFFLDGTIHRVNMASTGYGHEPLKMSNNWNPATLMAKYCHKWEGFFYDFYYFSGFYFSNQ